MQLPPLDRCPPCPGAAALDAWLASSPAALHDRAANADAPRGRIAVAYSGGADSTAMLVALAQRAAWLGVTPASPLLALHVHHGLQAAADGFETHARAFTAALAREVPVALVVAHATVAVGAGDSLEARARDARYDALASMARAHGAGTVLLAQHADDQVETMLIALGRGAGVAGLAGMAPAFARDGVAFARPWLGERAAALRGWLTDAGIAFIDDPSNADPQRTRNRIRERVLPALEGALPMFRDTFTRSARLAAQARTLLADVAAEDLGRVGTPPSIRRLQTLSRERQANLLRHWLRQAHATTPTEAQLGALLDVVAACSTRGHGIDLRVGRGHVCRDGEHLAFVPAD